MTTLSAIPLRVRKRWWVSPLLAIAPRVLVPLFLVSPRAAMAGFNGVARLLESRGLVIDVVGATTPPPRQSTT